MFCLWSVSASAATYYIGTDGDDRNSGSAVTEAWATFGRAWSQLQPGDTLVLLDGLYTEPLEPNGSSGTPEQPITIQAQHDGQAVIDGQGVNIPVHLYRDHYQIEGIVARNGGHAVYYVSGSHNTLRRVSGYNASTDGNSSVFMLYDAQHNVIEDCIAVGTGRKMLVIYRGSHNIIRRCFADWRSWDGRSWCDDWPWGDNIQIYNGDYNIIENSIGFGSVPVWSISVHANSLDATAIGNRVLGSISIYAGMNHDGSIKRWPSQRPQPTDCTAHRDFGWPSQRAGFALYGNGQVRDNLFRDILAWGSAGLGLTAILDGDHGNNVADHVTLLNNGLDNPLGWGGVGTELRSEELHLWDQLSELWVEGREETGAGARLTHRYVDGKLTNLPLWPWPMEARLQSELGLSPTTLVISILRQWEMRTTLSLPLIQDGVLIYPPQVPTRPLAHGAKFDKVDSLYYDDGDRF